MMIVFVNAFGIGSFKVWIYARSRGRRVNTQGVGSFKEGLTAQ